MIQSPSQEEDKAPCASLPGIYRRGSLLKLVTTCICGLTLDYLHFQENTQVKINKSSRLVIRKHLVKTNTKSISWDTSLMQTS